MTVTWACNGKACLLGAVPYVSIASNGKNFPSAPGVTTASNGKTPFTLPYDASAYYDEEPYTIDVEAIPIATREHVTRSF
eukprot:g8622.t1